MVNLILIILSTLILLILVQIILSEGIKKSFKKYIPSHWSKKKKVLIEWCILILIIFSIALFCFGLLTIYQFPITKDYILLQLGLTLLSFLVFIAALIIGKFSYHWSFKRNIIVSLLTLLTTILWAIISFFSLYWLISNSFKYPLICLSAFILIGFLAATAWGYTLNKLYPKNF